MEIGPFQRQYLDSVDNPHASAAQLLAKFDELYRATNALMAHLVDHGEAYIDGPLAIALMKAAVVNAIHDLDGGVSRD